MADIVKLKKKAADFEAKKQMDKALDVYREIVAAYEAGDEDTIDIPLYNRVGDMLQKAGNLPEAVSVWEKAVDRYTEGGFFNPAIALCNKILRASPGRTVIYYKLGKIHAEKGFKGDARQNFLEYASRQQKAGNLDDAFKALKEFAELVPDQFDVRLMLADQLVKAARKDEALEQLQLGYAAATEDGREDIANDIAAKMKEIDPSVEPTAGQRSAAAGGGGLVFLDLDDGSAPPAPPKRSGSTGSIPSVRASKAIEGLSLLPVEPVEPARPAAKTPTPSKPAEPAPIAAAAPDLLIEPTNVGADAPPPPRGSLMGLEVTNLAEEVPSAAADIPLLEVESSAVADVPLLDLEPTAAADVPLLDLEPTVVSDVPTLAVETTAAPEIPLLDVEPPSAPADLPMLEVESSSASADLPLLEVEPTSAANAPVLEHSPRNTSDFDLIEPEPTISAEVPSLAVEPSVVEEVPRLSGEIAVVPPAPLDIEPSVPDDGTFFSTASVDDLPLIETSSAEPIAFEPPDDSVIFEVPSASVPSALAQSLESAPLHLVPPTPEPDDESPIEEPETIPSQETLAIRASRAMMAVNEAILADTPVHVPPTVDELRARVTDAPEDWGLRRHYAEALLEQGHRAEALTELEAAMTGFEQSGDLDTAGSVAEEIVRLEPKSIRYHQKRVEFAFRANDRVRLAEAYIELADALLADGQGPKARAVYQRVLDITPDDLRAQAAIESIPAEEPPSVPAPRRSTIAQPKPVAPAAPAAPAAKATPAPKKDEDDDYVSLGDWLREDDEPKNTRMVVEEKEPTGDEEADFADMLRKFKQGVSDNVDEEDHEAHYDLGVAYKEMGLLDEAIAEFQKALRGTKERVRTFEALGLCFVEKGQLPVAATILQRALAEPGVRDESLVGVLYLLGSIAETQGQFADAKKNYERVFAVDIQFRDVGDRLNAVEQRLS